jgi:hypothetical protein
LAPPVLVISTLPKALTSQRVPTIQPCLRELEWFWR